MRIFVTYSPAEREAGLLRGLCEGHELVLGGGPAELKGVEVIFGQPDPEVLLGADGVKLVHLSSAGYTPYDRDDLRDVFRGRGAALTSSSMVYAEPCAEHALMFMLAHARAFPMAMANEIGPRGWPQGRVRSSSCLLKDETVLIVGFGAIGQRLAELLRPLTTNLSAVRRRVRGDEAIETRAIEHLVDVLPRAKHVVNTLPDSPSTRRLFDGRAFSRMAEGAVFYNIGRGTTVDQDALVEALRSGRLAAAYLDVCTPEPLPPDHPLWSVLNCHVTPHSAGGHAGEPERLIRHFVDNLRRLERGEPLVDRVY